VPSAFVRSDNFGGTLLVADQIGVVWMQSGRNDHRGGILRQLHQGVSTRLARVCLKTHDFLGQL
jgi:hypothetical protein